MHDNEVPRSHSFRKSGKVGYAHALNLGKKLIRFGQIDT